MTRAIDIIERACRILGIAVDGEALEASMAKDALSVLNGVMAEMYENIDVPEYTVSDLFSTMTIDKGDAEALAYELALRIAPEYGQAVTPDILRKAEESMSRLRNRYFRVGESCFDELPTPSSAWNSGI